MNIRNKRVLVVGSSSVGEQGSGALGKALKPQLLQLGASDVQFEGRSSRGLAAPGANQLVGTPTQRQAFATELAQRKPDVVLMVFGSNPSGTDAELADGMRYVQSTVRAAGAKLLWVGPPPYLGASQQTITNQYDAVGPKVLGDAYHSSQHWVSDIYERTADYLHFTAAGGQQWARAIALWVGAPSQTPLLWVAGVLATASAGLYLLRRRA